MQTCIDTCTCTECMNPHAHTHACTHSRSPDVWLTIHRMSLSDSSTTQHSVQEQHCMLAQSPSAPGWTRVQEIPLEWQGLTHNTPYLHLLMVLQHPSISCELECVYVCINTVVHTTYYIILCQTAKRRVLFPICRIARNFRRRKSQNWNFCRKTFACATFPSIYKHRAIY